MTRGEEKIMRCQFGVRGLLHFTAFISIVVGAYRIDPGAGFYLTVIMMAIYGRVLLRRKGTDSESRRAYGVLGSIGGGAFAGAGQLAVRFLWLAVLDPPIFGDVGLGPFSSLLMFCPMGAGFGGIIGVLVWFTWGIAGVWIQSIRELVGRFR